MIDKVSDKKTKERKVANIICEILKNTAATFDSNDPTHRNGVRYIISLKRFNKIIEEEIENRNLSFNSSLIVKDLIKRKLVKIC